MIKKLVDWVRRKIVLSFLGVLALALIVWIEGPLFAWAGSAPLESGTSRWIVIAILFLLWALYWFVRWLRVRLANVTFTRVVAEGAQDAAPGKEQSDADVSALRKRFEEAMAILRKSRVKGRFGSQYVYQLPWYMFVGAPGTGKTTALTHSGLKFPLSTQLGDQAVGGVGGTRNCDWWFTDQAVLIDTAGRYTTQDSQAAVDSGAWLGFLRLLKRYRRRQPLNGVLVAISLSDLALLSETERQAHARAIRKRIRELHDELGVRIPVYVLFTKADLIAGFVEFFDNLGREEREQVWGMTFPLDEGKDDGGAVAAFAPEFDALLTRLNDRMLERVHQEPDIQRRRLIYGFPQQIASLRDVAGEFLNEIFRPSRLEARPLLRGVYLTSGTQDGTPIDRLLGAMASSFGLQRQAVTAFSGTGRSYFLNRLVREVVFGEASLVSLDPKVEARARWTHRAAYAACFLVLLLLGGFWTASYVGNRDLIAQVHGEAQHYDTQYAALLKRGPQDTDLQAVLPALGTLRTMRGGYDARQQATPISLTFGLYQGNKLTTAAIDGYYRALNALLLPRLLARLEVEMQKNLDKPDFLYQALKVYLILGRQGPLDRALVKQWMQADFNATYPGDDQAETRAALMQHVDALLQRPPSPVPLNGPLVAQVRQILTREPIAEYSYNRLLRTARLRDLPEWTVADNAGPEAGRVFELRSGHSLNTGVPGVFTWSGYHTQFLPMLPQVTQDVTEDSWVLGREKRGVAATLAAVSKLRRDVLGLYLDDYTRHWDALIADVTIKPFGNLQEGLTELFALSGPTSPLRELLTNIDQQTQLSRTGATGKAAAQAEAKAAKVGQKVAGFGAFKAREGLTLEQTELEQAIEEGLGGTPGAGGKPVDPAVRVDEHFRQIHNFVNGVKGQPAPMEVAIQKIQALYQNFNQVANAPNQGQALLGLVGGGGAGGGGAAGGAAAQLQDLAKDLPKPIAAMLQTVSASSSSVTASGASQQLSDAWRSKVLPLCNAAFNRYPFVRSSSADVPPDDFAHLLGPGGLIDTFFNDNLKPFVDTTQTPWRWQSADHAKLGLSPGALSEFERAALIRDSLFATGNTVQVRFQLVPVSLDPGLKEVSVTVGGQTLTYNHGPTQAMAFQWPGAGGQTHVVVTMVPLNGQESDLGPFDDAWAMLRLLDASRVIPSGQPDKFQIVFSSPAGQATFELNASSVRNVFTLSALRSFRCPARL